MRTQRLATLARRAARVGVAIAIAAALVACGSSSDPRTPPSKPAEQRMMTRAEVCIDIAHTACNIGGFGSQCRFSRWSGEMDCRDWLMRACCRDAGTCREVVAIDPARMSQCLRQMEGSYDCNRLYTPACFELIPAARDSDP